MLVEHRFDVHSGTSVNDYGDSGADATITADGTSTHESDANGGGYNNNNNDNCIVNTGSLNGTALASASPTTSLYTELKVRLDAASPSRGAVVFCVGNNVRDDALIFATIDDAAAAITYYSAFGGTVGIPDTGRFCSTEGSADDLLGAHVLQAVHDTTQATSTARSTTYLDGVVIAHIFDMAQNAEFTLVSGSQIDFGAWHTGTSSATLDQMDGANRWGALDDVLHTEEDIEVWAAALADDDDSDPRGGAPAADAPYGWFDPG